MDDIDDKYNRAGHSVVYLKLMYVAYVISTAAVLLNILIAMLNSTYSSVQEIERSAWKVRNIAHMHTHTHTYAQAYTLRWYF